jgi:rhodanese-related sulfurtransferase
MIAEISVEDFATCQNTGLNPEGGNIQLVDVREPEELEVVQLPGFINLPLSRFGDWGSQIETYLDRDRDTYVLCHHGVRSAQMCHWLAQQGFTKVNNIAGGIHAYAVRVDRSLPCY